MVLESYGHIVPEIELRQQCECDDEGTFPSKIVEVARQHGLAKSSLEYLQLNELKDEISRRRHPIVYLELTFGQLRYVHSVVVVEIDDEQVHLLDPEIGERSLTIEDFNRAWLAKNGLTIIIE